MNVTMIHKSAFFQHKIQRKHRPLVSLLFFATVAPYFSSSLQSPLPYPNLCSLSRDTVRWCDVLKSHHHITHMGLLLPTSHWRWVLFSQRVLLFSDWRVQGYIVVVGWCLSESIDFGLLGSKWPSLLAFNFRVSGWIVVLISCWQSDSFFDLYIL